MSILLQNGLLVLKEHDSQPLEVDIKQGIFWICNLQLDYDTRYSALPYNNSGEGSSEDAYCQLYVQWLPFISVRPCQNTRNRLRSNNWGQWTLTISLALAVWSLTRICRMIDKFIVRWSKFLLNELVNIAHNCTQISSSYFVCTQIPPQVLTVRGASVNGRCEAIMLRDFDGSRPTVSTTCIEQNHLHSIKLQ